jgi:hypothetical protein
MKLDTFYINTIDNIFVVIEYTINAPGIKIYKLFIKRLIRLVIIYNNNINKNLIKIRQI